MSRNHTQNTVMHVGSTRTED